MEKENTYKEIIKYLENTDGFIKYNKMHIEEINENHVKIYADIDKNSLNPAGIVHGGLIFGLADTAMGIVAKTLGADVVTINSNIDYLHAIKGSKVYAVATPLKVGKTIQVYKTELYDENNKLCATATGSYYKVN